MRADIKVEIEDIDWDKNDGLTPAIVQDSVTGDVLMLGYVSKSTLRQTIQTGRVTFFSRSRQQTWTKGETSGNYLSVVNMFVDCDRDTLLLTAEPAGPTCHLQRHSCFGDVPKSTGRSLAILERDINERLTGDDSNSYTRSLMADGIDRVAQKVGEEAVEVVISALGSSQEAFLDESADLLYHLIVLFRAKGLRLADIEKVLASRRRQQDDIEENDQT